MAIFHIFAFLHKFKDAITLQDSLIAFYPFNNDAKDESGNNNNGIVNGAILTMDRKNSDNSAYYFDGIDNYIALPKDFDYKERTISLWFNVKESDVNSGNRIYNSDHPGLKYGSTNIDIYLGNLRFGVGGGQAESIIYQIEKNKWYHAVLIVDTLSTMAYVNGELINTVPFVNHHSNQGEATAFIGTNRDKIRYFFNGSIDDIRIFNRKLNEYEVVQLFNEENYLSANFIAFPLEGVDSLSTQFTDMSLSLDSNTIINSWAWDFDGDGIIDSEERNPKWTFKNTGLFTVKLIVSDSLTMDTEVKENYISVLSGNPLISKVTDVLNDQGRWVKVNYSRSGHDTDSLLLGKTLSTEFYTIEIDDGSGWTAAATSSAYGKSNYSVLVPTTIDSTSESNGIIYFRVIATMEEGTFVSQIDSGYSVDNLKPFIPSGLAASLTSDSMVKIEWQSNNETDFQFYTIYKKTDNIFEELKQTIDTVFIDSDVLVGKSYSYAITATDHSGNESNPSENIDITVTSLEEESLTPATYYLSQNYPNPFNPETTIKYGLKKTGIVKINVYDVLGNKVVTLLEGRKQAGIHTISFSGLYLSTGVYYYYIQAGNFTATRKMLLIK